MAEQNNNSPNSEPKRRWLGYLQLFLVIGVVVVALLMARVPGRIEQTSLTFEPAEVIQPRAVRVMQQPQAEKFTLQVSKTGNVNLNEIITVRAEVKGRITWISEKFKSGRTITADEVFVKIDPYEFQLQVDEAETLLRIAKLRQASAVRVPETDTSRIDARVRLLETRLDMARLELAKTEISLPYEIRVIRSDIEVGELTGPHEVVGPDASILGTGYRLKALEVSAPIETKLLKDLEPAVAKGATITVGGEQYSAKIDRVAPAVAVDTRLVKVFFRFDESIPKADLPLPGMFAEISLDGIGYDNVYVLPLNVMASNRNVWVVENGMIDSRSPVTVAITDDNWIVEPFDTADGIVSGSYAGLSRGEAVTVTP